MSIHAEWIDPDFGPEIVRQGEEVLGCTIDNEFAVVVGDDPVAVFEGTFEDLCGFAKRLITALDAHRPAEVTPSS